MDHTKTREGALFYYSMTLTLIALAILGVIVVLSMVVAHLFQARLQQQ